MAESEIEAIWNTVQEFIYALQRRDPTVRRWLYPEGEARILLDLYGEEALLTLLKDYLERDRFILLRSGLVPGEKGPLRLLEIGWVKGKESRPRAEERVTLRLRRVRRRWQVEDIWPSPLDAFLTVSQARERLSRREWADPAVLFLAGASTVSLEGCGELDDVETLFVLGMDREGFSPREIVRAVRLWRDFRSLRPAYRKPALYAAAVHYALSLLGHYGDARQSIAAYYGVNARSLGACFAKMEKRLGLVHFDPRYSAFSAPKAWEERWQAAGRPWPIPLGKPLEMED